MNINQALIDDMNACDVQPGQCAFWWLGQHGFVVKLGRAIFYLDCYLTPEAGRRIGPMLTPELVTNATAILGTHDHLDHIDRPAWRGMAQASPQATFVTPRPVRESVAQAAGISDGRVVGLNAGETATIGGVRISAVPAAHEFLDKDPATGCYPYLGYVLEGNGFCLYHAGDTCIYEGMQDILRAWRLDLAFLPINGRDARRLKANCIGNMTYQEAADLAGTVKPGVAVPAHYEMFEFNSANPDDFVEYVQVKYPQQRVLVPSHGERVLLETCGRR